MAKNNGTKVSSGRKTRKAKKAQPIPLPGMIGPRVMKKLETSERAMIGGRRKTLAIDTLDEWKDYYKNLAGRYQVDGDEYKQCKDDEARAKMWDLHFRCSQLSIDCAIQLAKYQTPTLKSVYINQEVIEQAGVSADEARAKMRAIINALQPDLLDEEDRREMHDDEPELTIIDAELVESE